MKRLISSNPYSDALIASYDQHVEVEVNKRLNAASAAFKLWRKLAMENRAAKVLQLADVVLKKKRELAELITAEMGKPIRESVAEIEKCVHLCRWYAENAPQFLKDKIIETDARESYVRYDPIGIVLAVMPWNYPFWQYFRFAIPNILAGNVGLLKHASNVSGCALAIEELFIDAGFPVGVSQTVLLESGRVAQLIQDDRIQAVTLTGSEKAGAKVASVAGEVVKKTVLELGGNNAVIVLDDASLDKYLNVMLNARFQNGGQSCIAGKRFLVQEGIYEEFVQKFVAKVKELQVGDPMNEQTKISCLASKNFAEELMLQLEKSLKMGAKLECGGKRDGAIFQPTVVTEVQENMPIFEEETFGPVAAITSFSTMEEAIRLSNASRFGLGAAIFTENIGKAKEMLGDLQEGAVFVNELVKSDARLPFGGVKRSGYGRELSDFGCLEFVNVKTIYIK